jgi:hypothetical protein
MSAEGAGDRSADMAARRSAQSGSSVSPLQGWMVRVPYPGFAQGFEYRASARWKASKPFEPLRILDYGAANWHHCSRGKAGRSTATGVEASIEIHKSQKVAGPTTERPLYLPDGGKF